MISSINTYKHVEDASRTFFLSLDENQTRTVRLLMESIMSIFVFVKGSLWIADMMSIFDKAKDDSSLLQLISESIKLKLGKEIDMLGTDISFIRSKVIIKFEDEQNINYLITFLRLFYDRKLIYSLPETYIDKIFDFLFYVAFIDKTALRSYTFDAVLHAFVPEDILAVALQEP